MNAQSMAPAAIAQPAPQELALSGSWTARGIGTIETQLDAPPAPSPAEIVVDGAHIEALDTAGAWVLQNLLSRLHGEGVAGQLLALRPDFAKLLEIDKPQVADQTNRPAPIASMTASPLARLGRGS